MCRGVLSNFALYLEYWLFDDLLKPICRAVSGRFLFFQGESVRVCMYRLIDIVVTYANKEGEVVKSNHCIQCCIRMYVSRNKKSSCLFIKVLI